MLIISVTECYTFYACKPTVVFGKTMYEVPPGGGGGGGGGFTMGSSSSLPRIDDVHEVNDNPSRKIKAYFSVFILKMVLLDMAVVGPRPRT